MGWRSHIIGSEPWGPWSGSEGCRQGRVRPESRDGLRVWVMDFGLGRRRGQGQGKHARSVFVGCRGRQRRGGGGGSILIFGREGAVPGVVRSRAQGAGVVGVRAEGIGVRVWGGVEEWVQRSGVQGMQGPGQRGEGAVGMDFGLGRSRGYGPGKHAVLRPTKKAGFEFFWGREGGSLVGGDRGQGSRKKMILRAGRGGSLVGGDRGGSWGRGRS